MQLIILTSVKLLRMRQRSTVRPWGLCSPAGKQVISSVTALTMLNCGDNEAGIVCTLSVDDQLKQIF